MNKEVKPHLVAVQHPNPVRRSYHVIREVSEMSHMYGFGRENMFSNVFKENPGAFAEALAQRLGNIPGIVDGHLKQYEISVGIGEAFDWKDVGPLVVGEIVKAVYPEVDGGTLEVSTTVCYKPVANRVPVAVNLGSIRPELDIEDLFGGPEVAAKARAAAERENSDIDE
jgi:hypothetical protein